MTSRIWGPFQPLPGCRLWLSENCHSFKTCDPETVRIEAHALLNKKDLARWMRYRPIDKKRQFLNSRVAIRAVLEREFGPASETLKIDTLDSGQPILRNEVGHDLMGISLSHSGNLIAVALSSDSLGIGVDIENVQSLNIHRIKHSFLLPEELEWLRQQGLDDSREIALAIWTMKEAMWKALGGPSDFGVTEMTTIQQLSSPVRSNGIDRGAQLTFSTCFFGHHIQLPNSITKFLSINFDDKPQCEYVGCIALAKTQPPASLRR